MKRTAQAVALLAVSLVVLSAGCYTVLRHPTGSSIVQEGAYYRSCADCHADAAFYHPYGHRYYTYGGSHYRWRDYYGWPWWQYDYWWDDWDHHDSDYDYDGPEIETGRRHLWSSDGWASGGWGFTKPESGTRMPPPPSQGSGRKDEQKEEPRKKDEKKEKEKDERHLWKKPKKGF